MYDRAPRNLTKTNGSTGQTVGPGTYDPDLTPKARIKSDGYAPFASMTSRETFLNQSDQVVAAPGPGQYDPQNQPIYVPGGRTLQNRSSRFYDPSTFTPGPGAYTLSKRNDWIKETGVSSSMGMSMASPSSKEQVKAEKGILHTSRVKFHRQPDAPSIPTPGKAYGYEENEDGSLRKQNAPDRDTSIGPAFYKPQDVKDGTKPTKTYRGNHFGNRTSKRMDFKGKFGPGPGDYEPYNGQSTLRAENANIRDPEDRKKYEARLPRYHELVVKDEEKKAVPGPGKYEIQGQFNEKPTKVNTEGIEVEHPPFLSQAKRFGPIKTAAPAPGTYNDPRNALDSLKRVTGLKRSPFGQTAVRFQPQHHVKKTPGPGAYNAAGMGSDSMRKAYIESTRKGVFGTTSVRIAPMIKKDEFDLPGPSHYQVKEKVFQPSYPSLTANFQSLTSRLTEPPTIIKEMPPPGSYEVAQSYQESQHKKDAANPRTTNARQKQGAFKSSASRFAPVRDIVVDKPEVENPGPGTYDSGSQLKRQGGLMVTKDKRFRRKTNENPGPGTYEFSPLVQHTVLHGTFNATLNNPITPQMEEGIRAGSTAKQAFLLGV